MHHLIRILAILWITDPIHTIEAPNERLVPVGSTTALTCEPTFGEISNATWYKDEERIAHVDSHQNVIYKGRVSMKGEEKMPDVGFLVIYNVQKEDEGVYYCKRDEDGLMGERYHLRTAYVDENVNNVSITIEPSVPLLGRQLIAHCPIPNAFPPPKITWTVNSLPISHISSDFTFYPNGTLKIAHFSFHHFGFFECHISNFAGSTSANVFIDSRELVASMEALKPRGGARDLSGTACRIYFSNSAFMFLMGCLVTSAAVLIYLGCAVCLLKPGRTRRVLRPTFWSRTDPRLAPGFRKAVLPLPDCFSTARIQQLQSQSQHLTDQPIV